MRLSLFILLLSFKVFAQDTQRLITKIDSVTLFLSASQINSSKTITLPQGLHTLLIDEISNSILINSLQINLPKRIKLVSVAVKKRYVPVQEQPTVKILQDSLDLVNNRIRKIEDQFSVLKSESELILNNKQVLEKENSTIQGLKDLALFYRSRLSEIKATEFKLGQTAKTEKQLAVNLKKRLQKLSAKLNQRNAQIQLVVDVPNKTTGLLKLQYLVAAAGWYPIYTFKIEAIDKPARLEYLASVYNNTGNDWHKVRLQASMADPTEDLKPPQLKPWYLNYRRPVYAKARQQFDDDVQLSQEAATPYYETEPKTFENVEVGNLDLTFSIPKTYTISSDVKAYHSIFIQSVDVPVSYKHLAIPKVKEGAYLILGLADWKKLGLISAPVYLYLRGTYLGESTINTETLQDTLDLSLGRDTWVDVRQANTEKVSKKFLGANVQETRTSTITIKNNYNSVLNLELRDQVPVSQHTDIQIITNRLNGAFENKQTGMLSWKVQIPAKTERQFNFSYTIKYPKSKPPIIKPPQFQKPRNLKFKR